MTANPTTHNITATIASDDVIDVRGFDINEHISELFEIELEVHSRNPDIDFEQVVGRPAQLTLRGHDLKTRSWSGICSDIEQTVPETNGVSSYRLTIVPRLWFLSQGRNYRIFQQLSEPEIVMQLLSEWDIEPEVRIDMAAYKSRKFRVQYAESDYRFMCRMLQDAGIGFYFADRSGRTVLVLDDAPHRNERREATLDFQENPNPNLDQQYATDVRVSRRVRPGRYTLRDHDYRLPPEYDLKAGAQASDNAGYEERLERFHYVPGAFLFGTEEGAPTPAADDKGKTRTNETEARLLAQKRLQAKRQRARRCTFKTNALDLAPGVVVSMLGHPRSDLSADKRLLVLSSKLSGIANQQWHHECEVQDAAAPYYPPLKAPKPKVYGTQCATVVGPPGEEIHTDDFGRVRVHFHWDRLSRMDDNSSCWIHVAQPWSGSGYGGVNLPRVGQEVLVSFLCGDPDRPIIVGRTFTALQKVPYGLPANKTQSGWRSNSTEGTGGYNEIMFEDRAGQESFSTQAEKDRNDLTKNNHTANVGRNCMRSVGADDSKQVGGSESKMIGFNQSTIVGGNMSITVTGAAVPEGAKALSSAPVEVGELTLDAKNKIVANVTGGIKTELKMEQGLITLTVGESFVMISEHEIALHAPKMVLLEGKQAVMANCSASAIVAKRKSLGMCPLNQGSSHLNPTAGLDPNDPGAPSVPESAWQQGNPGHTDPSGDLDGDGIANQYDHEPHTPYDGPMIGPADPAPEEATEEDNTANQNQNNNSGPSPTIGPKYPPNDLDRDGVINGIDNDPLNPNDNSIDDDKDGDGIPYWFDQNPDQPDFSPDPDYGGLDDWDDDGIPNYQDETPGIPDPDEVPEAWQNDDD